MSIEKPEDKQAEKEYTFDCCYSSESTQDQVYEDLGKPIVKNALEGYNSTVFACKRYCQFFIYPISGTEGIVGCLKSRKVTSL